jgi:plastocyanin
MSAGAQSPAASARDSSPAPSVGPDASASAVPTASGTPAPDGTAAVTLDITTPGDDPLTFSESTLSAPAGTSVTVRYLNDSDLPHNVAFFDGSDATASRIAATEVDAGPADQQEVTFTAPAEPGSYFFHCDVHPTQMTGTFEVTA